MRAASWCNVVPAAMLGQPLQEVSGTVKVVIRQPDASGTGAFCRGNAGRKYPCVAQDARLGKSLGVGDDRSDLSVPAMSRKAASTPGDIVAMNR